MTNNMPASEKQFYAAKKALYWIGGQLTPEEHTKCLELMKSQDINGLTASNIVGLCFDAAYSKDGKEVIDKAVADLKALIAKLSI